MEGEYISIETAKYIADLEIKNKRLNSIIEYFIDNIDENIVIITDYKNFRWFDDEEKGLDLKLKLNTYKGHPVILRNDMPPNNEFIIMREEDYLRNLRDNYE